MNNRTTRLVLLLAGCIGITLSLGSLGCEPREPKYGTESSLSAPMKRKQVWAIAPAINLSGMKDVDPLLQSDCVYQQLQEVRGIVAVPVNRVAEVYASLGIDKVQSEDQAIVVCDLLGCDALLVPTVTAYDPYNPPKFGGSLQLFSKPGTFARVASVDPRELSRRASPPANQSLPQPQQGSFAQAVGMYDAENGSVREKLASYAAGRHDPVGPLGAKEYVVNMDRYCSFAYHALIEQLLSDLRAKR